MSGIEALIGGGEAEFLYGRIPHVVEDGTDQLHLGVLRSEPSPELDERTSRQVVLFFAHVQGIPPSDLEAESIEGFLVAQVVPLPQKTWAYYTGNAEVAVTDPSSRRVSRSGLRS
jgi:hypothetical protein